jgi:hypothetical protein
MDTIPDQQLRWVNSTNNALLTESPERVSA